MVCLYVKDVTFLIYDLHISHNAFNLEASILVLLIHNSRSHGSLVFNSLELLCLATTLCLYKTRVTRVVCSCPVGAKITWPKMWNNILLLRSKIQSFLDIFGGVIGQNISLRYAASHLYNQFYRMKMLLPIEGLHDAVRTYTRTILPCSLVSFLYGEV